MPILWRFVLLIVRIFFITAMKMEMTNPMLCSIKIELDEVRFVRLIFLIRLCDLRALYFVCFYGIDALCM